jgi:hypothetical protein
MMNKNFDASARKSAAHEIPRNSKFSGWIDFGNQTEHVEEELLKPNPQGKGAGVRDALLYPRGIHAEMLKALLHQ